MRKFPSILLLVAFCWPLSLVAQSGDGDDTPAEADDVVPRVADEPDPFDELESLPGDDGGVQTVRTVDDPLETMSRDELESAGFDFGNESDGRDTSAALLLSLTAGTAIHGIGHLYLGDRRTGYFLLGMEGVSAGLIVGSTVFYALTEGASPWAAFFAPALQLGIAGFAFSYLVDVIGTLQGQEKKPPENTSKERGVGFRARYGLFNAAGLPVRHVIDGRLAADVGVVFGEAATTQDVFLDLASYRGKFGVRALRGADRLTFLSFQGNGEYLEWRGDGEFGRISADGRVDLSYQLGNRFPHIAELAFGVQGGLGNYWYQIAPSGTTTFALATSKLWVPFDVWGSMNISSRLNVRGGYGAAELSLVPTTQRLLGIAHIDLTYRSSSYGDISLRAEIGDGLALWLGGGLWFGR